MRQRFILGGGGLLVALAFALSGCQPTEDKGTKPKDQAGEKAGKEPQAKAKGKHDNWWCKEHGIPEEECLTCKHTEDELRKMGDWCEKHEVAKSQCFKCDPSLKEKYAAEYRAKYGKEPPPMEDEKEEDKKEPEKKAGGAKDARTKDDDKDGKK
jgi:hypothetical protein